MTRRPLLAVTAALVPLLLVAGIVSAVTMPSDRGRPSPGTTAASGTTAGTGADVRITRVAEAHFTPAPAGTFFVLLVGNDARPGQTSSRGDALHLVGVNPAAGQATILNIPRDLYVPIPGRGTDKINSALQFGGPQLQARTVSQLVGVQIPYVITTGFEGFMAMVDELGGFEVDVPIAMADPNSGAYFAKGVTRMQGGEALAFARNRNLPGGDFTRTENQARLIIAGLARLRAEGVTGARAVRWLSVLLRHVTLDGASWADLYQLGRVALSIDPAAIRSVTVPGSSGTAGSASVVYMANSAAALFADLRDDAVLQSQ